MARLRCAAAGRIRQARREAGLSQKELARRIGTDRRRVLRWERGEEMPRRRYRTLIAEATGQPPDFLDETDLGPESSRPWPHLECHRRWDRLLAAVTAGVAQHEELTQSDRAFRAYASAREHITAARYCLEDAQIDEMRESQ